MHSSSSAERFEFACQDCSHAVAGKFVVAGRFDSDEFADGLHERVAAGFEVTQAIRPQGIGLVRSSAGCFTGWHLLGFGLTKIAFSPHRTRRESGRSKALGTGRTV